MSEIALDDALFGEVLSPRVQQIIQLERRADDAQWEAARLITEELADGKSQTRLAREIGKSQTHVSLMAKTWRYYLGNSLRPAFNEAYHSPEIRSASDLPSDPSPQLELPLPEPESAPEIDPHWDELGDAEERGWGELDDEPDLDDEPEASRPHSAQPSPEQREQLNRMRQMADEAERANPYVPIRELVDIRDALRRAIPKMRALKNAGQNVGADGLTAGIASLYKELEELL